MRTMWEALKICLPITLMTFAIFTRSNIVVSPGWAQIADTLLITVSTCGVAFALFGRFAASAALDALLRVALAAIALVTMFHPDDRLVWASGAVVLIATIIGVRRHALLSTPAVPMDLAPAAEVASGPAPGRLP
jgi:hypothetical protein